MLGNNGRRDLVAERAHSGSWGPDKDDGVLECVQGLGEFWILGGMAPSCPDSMNACALGHVYNQVDVGVVVIIRPTRNLNISVGHADVVCVDLQVLWGGHHGELNSAVGAKGLIGPLAYGTYLLNGGNTYRIVEVNLLETSENKLYAPLLAMRTLKSPG
jgi:hypothetical protein